LTMQGKASSVGSFGGVGGLPFNVIDVAPSYDASP